MSEVTSQDKDSKQVAGTEQEINKLQPPTPKNYEIWALWNKGILPDVIAEDRGVTVDAVYYHIKTVNNYLKGAVKQQALHRARSKYNKVVDKWEGLIDAGHPNTINNAMNRDIFPDRSTNTSNNTQVNFNLVAQGVQAPRYDTDVEIIDTTSGNKDDNTNE